MEALAKADSEAKDSNISPKIMGNRVGMEPEEKPKTSRHKSSGLSKEKSDKIGRLINQFFNRAVLYSSNHPYTLESMLELYQVLSEGLVSISPLSIIMDRDKIFVEEEPVDSSVNIQRLVGHLKKVDIHSISFKRGIQEKEMEKFIKVFKDLNTYGTASAMQRSFPRLSIKNIMINNVIFKKVTLEQKVSYKRDSHKESPKGFVVPDSAKLEGKFVEALPRGHVQNLSLDKLIMDPLKFSKDIFETDIPGVNEETESGAGGMFIFQKLCQIRGEILQNCSNMDLPNLEKTAEAVQQMRKGILDEIETQKADGVHFPEESAIENELNDLSDQIIIRLIKEEYRQGEISTKRLSQIIFRLIPDQRDLKRLLPKIKEALIEEGMAISDYLELIKELGKELGDKGLVQALHDGAQEIGVSAEDLIREIRKDPKVAAELIVLAAEVRKELGQGDENVLTELLVDYVERVSGQMALESAEKEGPNGGKNLRTIMERVEQELLGKLRARNLETGLLDTIASRLSDNLEKSLDDVRSSWIVKQLSHRDPMSIDPSQISKILQNVTYNEDDFLPFFELIREKLERDGWNETHLQWIYDTISEKLTEEPEKRDIKAPKGALARNLILFILQGEIRKALRYPYPFSTLTLRIVSARPKKLTPIGSILKSDTMYKGKWIL
jgi:hypothetical protein